MSSPERYTLHLSRQAEQDIESILQYTYETYGERQRQIYAAALHEAFETITDNPGLGHRRPDLSERHRAFNVEQHVVGLHGVRQDRECRPRPVRQDGLYAARQALSTWQPCSIFRELFSVFRVLIRCRLIHLK